MSLQDYETVKQLGSGSFGTVVKVCSKQGPRDQFYAMKIINMEYLSLREKDCALNEIRLLASIDSPYVVSYKTAFFDDRSCRLCIVMEYAQGGDVAGIIERKTAKKLRFSENFIWQIAHDTLRGLKELHEYGILHRDIKPGNLFLSKGVTKLGDLNVSKVMEGKFAVTQAGTPYYTSPEIWNNQKYDGKCDIWSLGCVLYELATLQTPFLAKDVPELVRKVNCGKLDPLPPTYSRTLSEIIHQCLTVNPGQRPSAAALLTHKVFQFMKSTEEAEGEINLLATIRCPKAYNLIQGQLPESKSCKKSALKNSLENANFRKAVSPNRPLQCPPKVPFQAERPYSPS